MKWKQIETAPRCVKGDFILVCDDSLPSYIRFNFAYWGWHVPTQQATWLDPKGIDDGQALAYKPTHWCRLKGPSE